MLIDPSWPHRYLKYLRFGAMREVWGSPALACGPLDPSVSGCAGVTGVLFVRPGIAGRVPRKRRFVGFCRDLADFAVRNFAFPGRRLGWEGCFFKTGQRRVLRRGAGGASCIEVQMERALASCCGGTCRGPGLGLAVWSLGFPGWGFGGKSGFRGKQRFFSRRRIWILGDGTFPSSKRRGDGEGCFFKTGQRRVLRSGHGAS
jgi:hypothetical protein